MPTGILKDKSGLSSADVDVMDRFNSTLNSAMRTMSELMLSLSEVQDRHDHWDRREKDDMSIPQYRQILKHAECLKTAHEIVDEYYREIYDFS